MSCSPNLAPSGKVSFEVDVLPQNPRGLSLYVCGGGKALINFNGAPNNPGIM